MNTTTERNSVEALRASGCCIVHDEHRADQHFADVMQIGEAFAGSEYVQAEQASRLAGLSSGGLKDFLIRPVGFDTIDSVSPLLKFALGEFMLNTVCDALGCPVRLHTVEPWYVIPWQGRQKQWSHSWHRDPEDTRMIKAFLSIGDIIDECGPFEYVLGSHVSLFHLCPPGQYLDPAKAGLLPPRLCIRNTAPSGSLVMANTSGLHRGGYGTKPRSSILFSYVSDATGPQRRFSLVGDAGWADARQRQVLGI